MATLSQKQQLARDLFGREGYHGETRVYAPAVASSSGGSIRVAIGGEIVEIPVIGAVSQGQEVVIQVQDGHPVAIGARGWGDGVRNAIADMSATLSYVWIDDLGQLRITPEPREDDSDTGVMVNANGVNVIGYTYATHTGDNGFSVVMGSSPVLQVLGYAQQPDFQHNVIRSTDFLMLDADDGTADLTDLGLPRTRVTIAEESEAMTYNQGDVVSVDVDGVRKAGVEPDGDVYANGEIRAVLDIRSSSGGVYGNWGGFDNLVPSYYGTCDTAAGTQTKVVDCPAFSAYGLTEGALLAVRFSAAQTYNGTPTLTVNGQGPVEVKRQGTTNAARYCWLAGEVVPFVYDGTYWLMLDGGIATTTYYGATKLSSAVNSTSTSVAATPSAVKQAYDLAAQGGTDSGWLDLDTAGTIKYRLVGSMCTISASGTYYTSAASGWVNVSALPDDIKPSRELRALWYDLTTGQARRAQVNTSGLWLHQSGTADQAEFTITYPVG